MKSIIQKTEGAETKESKRISAFSFDNVKITDHWSNKSETMMESADNSSTSFSEAKSLISIQEKEVVPVMFQSMPIFSDDYFIKQTQAKAATIPSTKYKPFKLCISEEKSPDFYELGLVSTRFLHDKITDKSLLLLDCRSNIEFAQGRIKNSISITSPKALMEFLFGEKQRTMKLLEAKTILIFYCSNSKDISPFLMRLTRKIDRCIHLDHYPRLAFPLMYLLKGGAMQHFIDFPDDFEGKYVSIDKLEEHIDSSTYKKSSLRSIKKFTLKKTYLIGD